MSHRDAGKAFLVRKLVTKLAVSLGLFLRSSCFPVPFPTKQKKKKKFLIKLETTYSLESGHLL